MVVTVVMFKPGSDKIMPHALEFWIDMENTGVEIEQQPNRRLKFLQFFYTLPE